MEKKTEGQIWIKSVLNVLYNIRDNGWTEENTNALKERIIAGKSVVAKEEMKKTKGKVKVGSDLYKQISNMIPKDGKTKPLKF